MDVFAHLLKQFIHYALVSRHLGSQSRSILLSWIWSNIFNEINCVHENICFDTKNYQLILVRM